MMLKSSLLWKKFLQAISGRSLLFVNIFIVIPSILQKYKKSANTYIDNRKKYVSLLNMKVILIGAGNLATNLGKSLLQAGHDIVQVYSHTQKSASALAALAGGAPTNDLNAIRNDADIYILSVKDSVLADLIPQVCKGKENKIFVHTAGSMPMSLFEGMALHYGVLYPMQTFSKEKDVEFKDIPCFIEGNDDYTLNSLDEFVHTIALKVYQLSSEERQYLHLSAVFACNFVNHCYELSSEILAKHGLPFDVMFPLIDETARKVHMLAPNKAQTGPAVRYDENIIRKQSMMLKDDPILKDIYDRMSLSIHRTALLNKD
jgi:predicted short-subunit dehydrogenase-like oxidoreductase (DUF2520 family)